MALCGSDVARSLDAPENLPKEGVVDLVIRVRTREEPDSADLFRLLRPSRERRKSETDSENDREPDPPHEHLLERKWLAASLADVNYWRLVWSNASHAVRCVARVGECSMPVMCEPEHGIL